MDLIRCLYFDDRELELNRIAGWLERGWEKLKNGAAIEVTKAETIEKAEQELKSGSYDLLVADLLVGREKNKLGLTLIAHARDDYPRLAIVALSVNTALAEDARNAGADEFASKEYATDHPRENYLGDKLRDALRKYQREPASSSLDILKFDKTNLPLAALIETVERKNVINLANLATAHTCTVISAFFIRSGLSGASVIKVDCDYEAADGPLKRTESTSLLLKISRIRDSLLAELKKELTGFPEGTFVRFTGVEPYQSQDWYAIASKFKTGGRTLVDWLVALDTRLDQVEKLLTNLFLDAETGLSLAYRSNGQSAEERPDLALCKLLTLGRKARIRQALDELGPLGVKYSPAGVFDERLLTDFLIDNRIHDLNTAQIKFGFTYCLSHGDFHGRNIVVGPTLRASLIDPANVGELHWAADAARLIVDLVVSAWDYGPEGHEWNHMTEWVEVSRSLLNDEMGDYPGEKGHPNERVFLALRWLRDNIFQIHKSDKPIPTPEWEFRLALAIEFIRAAYRQQDLPSPKRVLGLIAGCEALRASSDAHKEFVKQ
jgi:CheY-like chemotaxis protein